MQVILLAAGQSTRLAPISDKNTLEFSGIPLVERQIAMLKAVKLRDIVVVCGEHNIDSIIAILKGQKHITVVEQENLKEGMTGGVLAGAQEVKDKSILVMSTNDVVDGELFEQIMKAEIGRASCRERV